MKYCILRHSCYSLSAALAEQQRPLLAYVVITGRWFILAGEYHTTTVVGVVGGKKQMLL